jgi:hypothetical protein
MIGQLMNRGYGKKWSWPNRDTILETLSMVSQLNKDSFFRKPRTTS